MKRDTILRKLFLSTLYLSAFTFGGGYVFITLLKKKFVDALHWIDETEMLDMVAIAQSSPGAIAVNGAIIVGYKLDGIPGVFICVLGAILPPFVILTAVSFAYTAFQSSSVISAVLDGMKPAVAAVILSTVYDLGETVFHDRDPLKIILMFVSFAATWIFHINVIWIILGGAAIGAIRTLAKVREKDGAN